VSEQAGEYEKKMGGGSNLPEPGNSPWEQWYALGPIPQAVSDDGHAQFRSPHHHPGLDSSAPSATVN